METNQTIQNGVTNAEIVGILRQIKTDIDELKATPARSLWDIPLWKSIPPDIFRLSQTEYKVLDVCCVYTA